MKRGLIPADAVVNSGHFRPGTTYEPDQNIKPFRPIPSAGPVIEIIEAIRARLDGPAVLLPIPKNSKGPLMRGWQKTTLDRMDDPRYFLDFDLDGNIGVLLGKPSKGLCTIDVDDDEKLEAFLILNPRLASSLRTRRVRGGNIWVRIVGSHPKLYPIKDAAGEGWGEWRADGGQTTIHGQAIDRKKGETTPTSYRKVVDRSPVAIAFAEIVWPDELTLPWKPKQAGFSASPTARVASSGSYLILPSGAITYTKSAVAIFTALARTLNVFVRATAIVELVAADGEYRLDVLRPAAFRSRLDNAGLVVSWRKGAKGQDVLQEAHCSEDTARVLLDSLPARQLLPPIASVTACPVVVQDASGNLRELALGYHPERGGILVTAGELTRDVPLAEAVSALKGLLDEFDFVSTSDRSRAIAAFISPALVLGGLLSGRVPADVAEADQSQAGKGYRQKLVAAIYNEKLRAVAQRNGGVGSLDESFSEALIGGKPFIQLDNLRGALDSPYLESFFTADSIGARVPHRGEVPVDPSRFFIFASSNGVETTRDMANRASIVRIRKRNGHAFHNYPEGGLIEHVKARQPYFLGCVFSVVAEWLAHGRARTKETRHDFREWAQSLDWIVQHVFGEGSLLDGHEEAQRRVSNPAMVFLRSLCLVTDQERRLGESFSASMLAELAEAHGIPVPGLRVGGDERATSKQIGIQLARLFRESDAASVKIDTFIVSRTERPEIREDGNGIRVLKAYMFERI